LEEYRQYIRFAVSEDVFAALGPSFSKVGKIKDISINGLAFEYIADSISVVPFQQVDIFDRSNDFYVPKIPCNIVYDDYVQTVGPHKIEERNFTRRRCGVRFEKLVGERLAILKVFLESNACVSPPKWKTIR